FTIELPEILAPFEFQIAHPRSPRRTAKVRFTGNEAFLPPRPVLPKGFIDLGGLPVKVTPKGPVVPDLGRIKPYVTLFPWARLDWHRWFDLFDTIDPCTAVPAKTGYVEIAVDSLTNMCRVSKDCGRVYTVSDRGQGCVVNVITESIDAGFTVAPNPSPSPPHPSGITPLVHPFTKGGINHKYQRLYVPASFYSTTRTHETGGFYVAVVDIDPDSPNYLSTISWIDCGWIPEEVAFSANEEIGVIANYMQGTATFFQASTGAIIGAKERDGFTGAAAGAGDALSRSVRCANVPGIGNRAYMTLTDKSPKPGLAVFDLDSSPGFPRSNIDLSGFVDGVALSPDRRHLLALSSSNLFVVRVDVDPPVLERTIALPTGSSQSYFGGLAVRPTGDLVFLATGSANSTLASQGTSLTCVNWVTGTTLEVPGGLASQTWGLEIHSFGSPLKPHIFVCSRSGKLTIIPC
ncbi:MAG: hypothetical protein O7B26_10785, partial [Planctomycetota bacterium]|nr:hypothetical protein [Planctomycetota bacterium]